MSAVGPELPPHLLAKRKRQREESEADDSTTTSPLPGAKRSKSPTHEDEQEEKRPRVKGPAPPPAPLDERPTGPADGSDSSSDDDDDFGPAPPSAADLENDRNGGNSASDKSGSIGVQPPPAASKRDEWMTMPPKADDLSRVDPLKPRPRGFNTGKSARNPAAATGPASAWTETPEQKLKRLQDEAMGVVSSAPGLPASDSAAREAKKAKERADREAKIRAHTESTRGMSLLAQHQGQMKGDEEDDPSKRSFDREKDMSSGIGRAQKKEMITKAANFSTKFAGGGYL